LKISDQLKYKKDSLNRSYIVKNIDPPALLIWTDINYHDLASDDSDYLEELLLTVIPADLLKENVSPKGFLFFADGGEPRISWPISMSYEQLVAEVTSDPSLEGDYFRWMTIPHEKLASLQKKFISNDEIHELEFGESTPAQWRRKFSKWLEDISDLTKSNTATKTWWEVSSFYFTNLHLEDGFTYALKKGFLSKDEIKMLKKFDSCFRNYIPESHDTPIRELTDPQWLEICNLAKELSSKWILS